MPLTRRELLRRALPVGASLAGVATLAACQSRFVQVSPIMPVTRPATPQGTRPSLPAASPTATPFTAQRPASPAAPALRTIVADVTAYGWTQFAVSRTAAFEQRYPEVRLQWRTVLPWPDYVTRVAVLAASGDPPDLLEAPFGVTLSQWSRTQVAKSLGDAVDAAGLAVDDLLSAAVQACTVEGRLMGIPFLADPGEALLLYAPDALSDIQGDLPAPSWTLDDLGAASRSLTDSSADRYGYGLRSEMPGAHALLHLFARTLLAPGGRRCGLDDERGIECLTWLQDLIYPTGGAAPPRAMIGGALAMLARRAIGMVRGSLQDLRTLRRLHEADSQRAGDAPAFEAVVFPMHPQTGRRASTMTGMAYCLGGRSRADTDVLRWIEMMTSAESGAQLFLGGYAGPGAHRAAWRDDEVIRQEPAIADLADVAEEAVVEPLPWNDQIAGCYEAWTRNVVDLLDRRVDPATCAAQVCAEIREVLRRGPPVVGPATQR